MPELILHHYDGSPYAEKIRLALGLKGLAWRSVEIPRILPKPDLMPLTGGYRRTPVLQIGADIYCDTERIATELERRRPHPTLYPDGSRGLAAVVGLWVSHTLFSTAVGWSFSLNAEKYPLEFHQDRAAMRGAEVNLERIKAAGPRHCDRLRAQLDWIEATLVDGRRFLLGANPGLADLSVYHCLWFVRRNGRRAAAVLEPYERTRAWMERVARIGHGTPTPMEPTRALDVARRAQSSAVPSVDLHDASGLRPGDRVTVTAEDTGRDPVAGEVVRVSVHDIAIRRSDPRVGEVVCHFPRVGYQVRRLG
jgi:glutathione S-transferase